MEPNLVAPCGFPCALCSAFQNPRRPCRGCGSSSMQKHCIACSIRCCGGRDKSGFCYDCAEFPCRRLKRLDASYRKNYHTSLIFNLNRIKEVGLDAFWQSEKERWTCSACGKFLCLHSDTCLHCGATAK